MLTSLACIHPYPVTADDLKSVQTCADFGEHSAETCANVRFLNVYSHFIACVLIIFLSSP